MTTTRGKLNPIPNNDKISRDACGGVIEDHKAILEAIIDNNHQKAYIAMGRHLEMAKEDLELVKQFCEVIKLQGSELLFED